MIVHAGVPVVTCEGRLGDSSIPGCLRVLSHAVSLRPRTVVIDLARAAVDQKSASVLRLMQHFTARHGIKLALAAVPPRALNALRRVEVTTLCEVHATLPLAIGAAVAQSHRSLPRRQTGD